ncbi:hypothetical protein [Mesorhizobium sp. WSM2239]|uniref:Uncharacterized protein n=2 Tax=unclassified Mesorhizobium TaxID=325217 RepID=A0AAU8DI39_9HYPH
MTNSTTAQAIAVGEVIRLLKLGPDELPDRVRQAEESDRIKVHNDSVTLRGLAGDQNLKPEIFW